MSSHQNQSPKANKNTATIYVKGIPKDAEISDINKILKDPKVIKVIYKQGSETAQLSLSPANVDDFIRKYNFIQFKTKTTTTAISLVKTENVQSKPENAVFLRNLPESITEREIFEKCCVFGDIEKIEFKSKISAAVFFSTSKSASEALSNFDKIEFPGIEAQRYEPNAGYQDMKYYDVRPNIRIIEGLPKLINEQTIRSFLPLPVEMDLIPHRGIAIIYFETDQDALKFTETPIPELKIVSKARLDIINRIKESCAIFFQFKETPDNTKPEIVEEKLRQHLSLIHPFINFSLKKNVKKDNHSCLCEVEYATPSHRTETIKALDLRMCDIIKRPLRLFPFVIDHGCINSGILLLPELPLSTTYEQFREESLKFGQIISISLFPFEPELGGMVLYDHYKDALRASEYFREIYNNAFVFPVNAHTIIPFFWDQFETRSSRSPNMEKKHKTFYVLFHGITNPEPFIKDGKFTKIGDSLLVPYNDFESALNIYNLAQSQNISSNIISKFCYSCFVYYLRDSPFPIDFKENIIWATFSKPENARTIREIASSYFPVDSAFPVIDSNENLSNLAYIQAKRGAETFWYTNGKESLMNVSFKLYCPKEGYTIVEENLYMFPKRDNYTTSAQGPITKKRNYLKDFVNLNAPEVKKDFLIKEVEKLCINDQSRLTSNEKALIQWYEHLINQ